MKKVLCIGDSLGLPRPGVSYEQTWFAMLQNHYQNEFCFIPSFRRALTSADIASVDNLEIYNPQIVILQVGIVDCAPRLFKRNSKLIFIINRAPSLIKSVFWRIAKKIRQRKLSNADVSISEFKENLSRYLDRCQQIKTEKVVLISIQNPGSTMLKNNPELLQAIQLYNNILSEMVHLYQFVIKIDPLRNASNTFYVEDGYHLNELGAKAIFENIKEIL